MYAVVGIREPLCTSIYEDGTVLHERPVASGSHWILGTIVVAAMNLADSASAEAERCDCEMGSTIRRGLRITRYDPFGCIGHGPVLFAVTS